MPHEFDYAEQMEMLVMLVRIAAGCDVDLLQIEHVHARAGSIGPILLPTEFRSGMQRLDDQAAVISATGAFIRASRKIVETHEKRRALRAGDG